MLLLSLSSCLGSIYGDLIALLGAMVYACYAIYLRVRIPDERALSMPMFFGFVGLLNLVLLPPFGVLLHYTGVERFVWPSPKTLGFLFLNGKRMDKKCVHLPLTFFTKQKTINRIDRDRLV